MAPRKQLAGARRGHAGRPDAREDRIGGANPQRGRVREGRCLFFGYFCLNLVRVGLHHSTSARQVSDPHLDAKVFPFAHPYGTGSVNAEGTSVQPQRVCRNRMLSLQSFFRRSSRYAFWQLDMMIKRHLFFFNLHRVNSHRKSTAASDDKFAQAFGTIIPRNIPESSAWWKVRFCLCVCCPQCARSRARRGGPEPGAGGDMRRC